MYVIGDLSMKKQDKFDELATASSADWSQLVDLPRNRGKSADINRQLNEEDIDGWVSNEIFVAKFRLTASFIV